MTKKKYEFIEHTADIGIKVFGKDLDELFINAATAMFDIIVSAKRSEASPKGTTSPVKKFIIDKKADNLENLLVEWLGELLFLYSTKNIVFDKFDIKELDDNHINAVISGWPTQDYKIKTEIKAVTYHMLKVWQEKNHWFAQLIFDV